MPQAIFSCCRLHLHNHIPDGNQNDYAIVEGKCCVFPDIAWKMHQKSYFEGRHLDLRHQISNNCAFIAWKKWLCGKDLYLHVHVIFLGGNSDQSFCVKRVQLTSSDCKHTQAISLFNCSPFLVVYFPAEICKCVSGGWFSPLDFF